MRLVQFLDQAGKHKVGVVPESGTALAVVAEVHSVYRLALDAARKSETLTQHVQSMLSGETADYDAIIAEQRLLPPLTHPDPHRCLVTGTGLSHLGSAAARDSMHAKIQKAESELTDSMKMFKWGMEGGKPKPGEIGTAPEWFYKGDGHWVAPPEKELELPAYADDGGEEVEVVGLYVIGDHGQVLRVGFALGNEYSDHVMERKNYLYLAHSKLRQCSYGPELLTGELPKNVTGSAKLLRNGQAVWSGDWLSGEDNMAHSVWNLEHHHFKYPGFRRPGDVHVHFFGAATGSFTANVATQPGDVFEISSPNFGRPLRNKLVASTSAHKPIAIQVL
jgi:hypothetical protein